MTRRPPESRPHQARRPLAGWRAHAPRVRVVLRSGEVVEGYREGRGRSFVVERFDGRLALVLAREVLRVQHLDADATGEVA